jgi:ribosomal protein S18 acetylase RimI-like enzyme
MVTVRPLVGDDAALCDEIVSSLTYHFAQEDGRRECAVAVRSEKGLVAVKAERVVGFLTFVPRLDQAAEITWMAVQADHRRQGIGRLLIESLVAHLRESSMRLVLVLTVSPNGDEDSPRDGYSATRAFYGAMGFTLARDLHREWPNDVAVLMVRSL